MARRLRTQRREYSRKLDAQHVPEVECIAKGKARTPCELGVKVSVAVTAKQALVVGMRAMPGNLCDGHTLEKTWARSRSSAKRYRRPCLSIWATTA